MSTTFEVIFIGTLAKIDTTQGNEAVENAGGILGTYGSSASPLSSQVRTLSSNSLTEDDNTTYDLDNCGGFDSFRINGGTAQNFDASAIYNATITYVDGTTANVTAVVFQDVSGNTYLAPEETANADQAALTAKPILSLSLNSVASNTGDMLAARVAGDFISPVDGTAAADTMNVGYTDAQGDKITTGNDFVLAGAGNDSVSAGDGRDTVFGGDGNDTITGGNGDDSVDGGTGDDRIGDWSTEGGNDTFRGGAGNDQIIGGGENDLIYGDDGNDTISGGAGNDSSYGGAGNDAAVITEDHNSDLYDLGENTGDWDIMSFGNYLGANGVNVTFTGTDAGSYSYAGGATGTFTGAEQINTTVYADTINAGSDNDGVMVYSGGGADSITGGAGNDSLFGDAGNDSINAGSGADYLEGGDGNDTINFGTGNNTVYGGAGDDLIDDAPGGFLTSNSFIDAGSGNDTVWYGEGNNTVYGGSGNDLIDDHGGGELAGASLLYGGDGFDTVYGTLGNDTLFGDAGNDLLFGESGNDLIQGGGENDSLSGGDGDDTLDGGQGADSVDGGAGNDSIDLTATDFADDVANGGAGNDALTTRVDLDGGNDTLFGGDGRDTFVAGAGDSVVGGEGGDDFDRLDLSTVPVAVTISLTGSGMGTATGGGGTLSFSEIEAITGTANADTVSGGADNIGMTYAMGGGHDVVTGGSGADSVDGGIGDDSIAAGAGNDTVQGGDGVDTLDGGIGNDSLAGGAASDSLAGGDGSDSLFGDDGSDRLFGGAGDDQLTGGEGNDSLFAGTGNDLTFGGDGNDEVAGEAGDDSLYGGAGADTLLGGTGNDLIDAGTGNDQVNVWNSEGTDTLLGGENAGDVDALWFDATSGGVQVTYTGDESGTYAYDSGGSGNFDQMEFVWASAGNDVLDASVSTGGVNAAGWDGEDRLTGGAGNDSLAGEFGNDTLRGGDGNDTLVGGDGADSLAGGTGDDILSGGTGNDQINGGAGTDTLSGGDGNDVFAVEFADTGDRITDFSLADSDNDGRYDDQLDVSELRNLNGDPVTRRDVVVADDGSGNARLTFPEGETIILSGVSPAQMSSQTQLYAAGIPCFAAGSMILTPKGEVAVEALRPGDLVVTRDNGPQPVVWSAMRRLTRDELSTHPDLAPVAIAPGAFGQERRLLVSPQHALLVRPGADECFARAVHLARTGGSKIRIAKGMRSVTYVHLMFARHEVISAHGIWSESFFPGPWGMRALDVQKKREIATLFPDLIPRGVAAGYGPTARQVLKFAELRHMAFMGTRLRNTYRLDLPGECGEHQLRNQEVFYGKRVQTDAGVSA